jgi:hypothetical protein
MLRSEKFKNKNNNNNNVALIPLLNYAQHHLRGWRS